MKTIKCVLSNEAEELIEKLNYLQAIILQIKYKLPCIDRLFYNSLVWLDTRDASSWDRNSVDFMPGGELIAQPSVMSA